MWAASRSACVNASPWRPPSSATRPCSSSTSPPTASIPKACIGCERFLRSLADAGRTVVVSSHLLAEVSQTVDHVVILDKGRLVASTALDELTASAASAVIVRTPDAERFQRGLVLRGIDATVTARDEVTASGTTPEAVGEVIAALALVVYEMRLAAVEPRGRLLLAHRQPRDPVMNRLIHTELLKQRTTRTFLAGITAAPLIAGLVTLAILSAAGTQGNEPLGPDSLVQVIGGSAGAITLIAVVLGVLGMTGEYRHQTITTTFLASPRRRNVVIAKLAAHSLSGAAMGVLSIAVSATIAIPWLLASGVDLDADARALRVAVGVVVSTALYGSLGVSIGALLRNQTAASAAVLVWLLAVEGLIGDLLGRSALLRWLPAAAGRALVQVDPTGDTLSLPTAAAVFTAYVAVFALAGIRFTLNRDIT